MSNYGGSGQNNQGFNPHGRPPINPKFGPKGYQQRNPLPSMSPPRHLPFHIIPPEQLEEQKRLAQQQMQQSFQSVSTDETPKQSLNQWKPPENHPFWRTSTLSFEKPSGPPPPPSPSKPVSQNKSKAPVLPKKMMHPPSMAPPRHLPTNIIPPTDSVVLPLKNIPVYQEPPKEKPPPKPMVAQNKRVPNKKKKKKKLNKFSSAEIEREEQVFVPKSNPLQPIAGVVAATPGGIRGRKNSKNATSAFIAAASPNGARFDNAIERMQAKMNRQPKNDFVLEAKPKPKRNRERRKQKSKQVQNGLSMQFGFLQNKFQHKEKQATQRRKRPQKKRAPALTTPTGNDNNPTGISSWV